MTLKRLNLSKETLRPLDDAEGRSVLGGMIKPPPQTQVGTACSVGCMSCVKCPVQM